MQCGACHGLGGISLQGEHRIRIYVRNLSTDGTGKALGFTFRKYGEVESTQIAGGEGRSANDGYVAISARAEGEAAVLALGGIDLLGRPTRLAKSRYQDYSGGLRQLLKLPFAFLWGVFRKN